MGLKGRDEGIREVDADPAERGDPMRTLLDALLVMGLGAAGCQPAQSSKLDQCREAVKAAFGKHCAEGFSNWSGPALMCDRQTLYCLQGFYN